MDSSKKPDWQQFGFFGNRRKAMVTMRYATRADWGFWLQLDRHLTKKVFLEKCRKQTAFVL